MNEFVRFWGLVLVVVAILVVISIFLMKKFKKHPVYKYIPTLAIWLLSVFFFVMAVFFAQPMQDLGYFVMAMITGAATFISLILTIVISKIMERKK